MPWDVDDVQREYMVGGGSALMRLVECAPENSISVIRSPGKERTISSAELLEGAVRVGARLAAAGVERNDLVLLVAGTSIPLLEVMVGVWLLGAATCVAQPPIGTRYGVGVDSWAKGVLDKLRPDHVVVDVMSHSEISWLERREPVADGLARATVIGLNAPGTGRRLEPDTAIVQLTSGSTGSARGVQLTVGAIEANIRAVGSRLNIGLRDVFVSWLPLHHDMGLIGNLLLPMMCGSKIVLIDTTCFARLPRVWAERCARDGATFTCGTDSSYRIFSRVLQGKEYDLSSLRTVLNGAEPIDVDSYAAFSDAASRSGMNPRATLCVYGLAESTVGATVPDPGSGISSVKFDRQICVRTGEVQPSLSSNAVEVALLGSAIQGMDIRIVDGNGKSVGEDHTGNIEIKGSSLAGRYLDRPLPKVDGWYDTGDVGFLHDGQVAVTGRSKAMVIVGGVNYMAEDIERVVAGVSGVRHGNVAVIGVQDGGERLVIMAETRSMEKRDISRNIYSAVLREVGLAADVIRLLGPGEMPRTSSGKVARSECLSLIEG